MTNPANAFRPIILIMLNFARNGLANVVRRHSFHSTSVILDKNFYEILGVKKSASANEIKAAYFQLSKLYHPDAINAKKTSSVDTKYLTKNFQDINEAYDVLKNTHKRQIYNESLRSLRG